MTGIKRSLKQIFAIGHVTFREIIRERVLWSSFVFGVLSVGLAYAVSQLSYTDNGRLALDFGMTSVSLIGGLISVMMGAALIAKEVQNRTLYLVLTKAIWRWQFVVGRFLGLLVVITLNSLVMIVIASALMYFMEGVVPAEALTKNFILQVTEFGVIAASACVFSAMSTATLAAIFASGIWVIGHAMTDLRILSRKIDPPFLRPVLDVISRVLPDLTKFDVKAQVSHTLPITWSFTFYGVLYGACYVLFALVVACLFFSRRDL